MVLPERKVQQAQQVLPVLKVHRGRLVPELQGQLVLKVHRVLAAHKV